MDLISTDVAIIGAGGAGLRAAIAVAQADPSLSLSLLSKVYPMRSHTVAAEGGAAGVIKESDNLDYHFHDTVSGGDWLCDQDAVELFVNMAPRELLQMEHWGCPWSREPSGRMLWRSEKCRFFGRCGTSITAQTRCSTWWPTSNAIMNSSRSA